MTFQELYNIILQKRNDERRVHPVIRKRLNLLVLQIYANSPLQFVLFYGTEFDPELEFKFYEQGTGERKKIVVSAKNPVASKIYAKKEFGFGESVGRLTEEFIEEPHVEEIVYFLNNIQNYL